MRFFPPILAATLGYLMLSSVTVSAQSDETVQRRCTGETEIIKLKRDRTFGRPSLYETTLEFAEGHYSLTVSSETQFQFNAYVHKRGEPKLNWQADTSAGGIETFSHDFEIETRGEQVLVQAVKINNDCFDCVMTITLESKNCPSSK